MAKLAPFPEAGKPFELWASGNLGRVDSVDKEAGTLEIRWESDEDGASTTTWLIDQWRERAKLVTQKDHNWPARL